MPGILVDIGHPAHVHLFKHLIRKLRHEGLDVYVTAREKDISVQLLEEENIEYENLGPNHPGLLGKIKNLVEYDYLLYRFARKVKPDLFISHSSIYAAHTAYLLGKKSITLEDTGNADQSLFYRPFTSIILTPQCLRKNYGPKQIRYNGYHELAYLHPEIFSPNLNHIEMPGVGHGESFVILRFVSRTSSHDLGMKGISQTMQLKAVQELSKYARVFISSEKPLPKALEQYRFPLRYSAIHHAIYHAAMVFGESATMSSEAAILGTPAIFLDKIGRDYTKEQEEKYGLVFNFTHSKFNVDAALNKAVEILTEPGIKEIWKRKANQLLNENINLTEFMYKLIINEL